MKRQKKATADQQESNVDSSESTNDVDINPEDDAAVNLAGAVEEPHFTEMEPAELLAYLVKNAYEYDASDAFVLTDEHYCELAVRRMGATETVVRVPHRVGQTIINTIKSQCGMDLGEKRRPTDGRWSFHDGERRIDFRVNSMGTLFGEDITLRLLRSSERLHDLDDLGFVANQTMLVRSILDRPGGLILVTGPSGAGKTTTLYSCLNYLNNGQRKINTLEDPIEHAIEGVRQSQVMPKLGLEFSDLLKGAMRQSPDVIMVGEIRDAETANIAVRAANSGHLVLATLHAPLATSAVQSMLALGVQPFFLSNALTGVIAQRLIRVLDPNTRLRYEMDEQSGTFDEVKNLLKGDEGKAIYGPKTDGRLPYEGYVGRTGMFEIMTLSSRLRDAISSGATGLELRAMALSEGMAGFRQAGLVKVATGITSVEEITRSVPETDPSESESGGNGSTNAGVDAESGNPRVSAH